MPKSSVAEHFEALCQTPYQEHLKASDLQYDLWYDGELWELTAPMVLWDDPLLGMVWRELPHWEPEIWHKALLQYQTVRAELTAGREHRAAGDVGYAWDVADVMIRKIELRRDLLSAYEARDFDRLKELKDQQIPELIHSWQCLAKSFRRQWLRRNKPFGLEVMQIRFAGQIARCDELACRLAELLAGELTCIDELEVKMESPRGLLDSRFGTCASGCFL